MAVPGNFQWRTKAIIMCSFFECDGRRFKVGLRLYSTYLETR